MTLAPPPPPPPLRIIMKAKRPIGLQMKIDTHTHMQTSVASYDGKSIWRHDASEWFVKRAAYKDVDERQLDPPSQMSLFLG